MKAPTMAYVAQIQRASRTARLLGQAAEARNVAMLFEADGDIDPATSCRALAVRLTNAANDLVPTRQGA